METVILLAVLILSIVLHEVAHGYAANALGDPTARLAGRLNVNPLNHIDPMGSVILPALLVLSHAPFLFGWAKPVPYNPYNLNNQKWGEAMVAAAGPATNFLLALIFAAIVRFAGDILSGPAVQLAVYIVQLNIVLGLFNILPLPFFDGSKVIEPFLPRTLAMRYNQLRAPFEEKGAMGMIFVLIIFTFLLAGPFSILVDAVTDLFLGSVII